MNKLFYMTLKIYVVVLVFFLISCSKELEKVQPKPNLIPENTIVTSTQTTATFNYKLLGGSIQETGLYFSTDSILLAQNKEKAIKVVSVTSNELATYTATITNLSIGTTYYYSIYIKDSQGVYTSSNPIKFTSKGYGIHWQDNFSQQIKLTDWLYRDVILVGKVVDAEIKNYKVTLGTTPCMLWKIAKSDPASLDYLFYIQVPAAMHIGKFKLSLSYLGKEIFNDDLEVLKGNLYLLPQIAHHPLSKSYFNFFQYDNKLYTIEKSGNFSIDSWNPTTNTWQHIGTAPTNFNLGFDPMGLEINGKIWFAPVNADETYLAYTPATNSWETGKLYIPKGNSDFFTPYGTFVYQDKLYCMGRQTRGNNGGGNVEFINILKVFNPTDKSWNLVMNLDDAAWDYKGTVLNGKIYLLATKSEPSTQTYKSDLYELNIASKQLDKKPDVTWYNQPVGMIHTALFSFNNHVYMYGGNWQANLVSTDMYEYDPGTNSWTKIFLSPNSQLGGVSMFCNVFNNKIYLGFGVNYTGEIVNDIWELDLNKSL